MAIRYLTAAAASGCGAVTRALNETGGDRIQRIDTGNAAILQLVSTMEDSVPPSWTMILPLQNGSRTGDG